jgi:transposase
VSADAERAAQQMERRSEVVWVITEALRTPTSEETLEILVETLRAAPQVPEAALVAKRLGARGVRVEGRHVQPVFEAHGLQPEKKTAPPSSRPSQR